MVGVSSPVAEIGVSLRHGVGQGRQMFNRYNFGYMTASDSMFDSRRGFSGTTYPMKILPRSELLDEGDCQVLALAHILYSAISCVRCSSLMRSGIRHVLTRDHTVLPATHTFIHIRNERSQPQSVTVLWPVLISRPTEGGG